MVNPFEQTPAEKEEYVLDMLERGYSYSQIMKECHVSPKTISSVKKKLSGSADDDASKGTSQISKETQALKLFNEGKKPIDVAIELDIATDYVFVVYQNFQRLRNQERFISCFEQVKGNMEPFLDLFGLMNYNGMTPEQVAEQVKYGSNLPYLESKYSALSNGIGFLESQRLRLFSQLNFMQSQIEQYNRSIQFYENECQRKTNQLLSMDCEINARNNIIQDLDNDEGYTRIKEAAKRETKLIIQNNQLSSAVTLSATFEAIRRYPDSQTLFFDIVTTQTNAGASGQQPWMESHTPQLLQLMQNIQNEMAERITEMIIHTINQSSLKE